MLSDDMKNVERTKLGKQQQHVAYGDPMPQRVDQEELCNPQETCAACPVLKCTYRNIADYAYVQPLRGVNFTGLPSSLPGTFNRF